MLAKPKSSFVGVLERSAQLKIWLMVPLNFTDGLSRSCMRLPVRLFLHAARPTLLTGPKYRFCASHQIWSSVTKAVPPYLERITHAPTQTKLNVFCGGWVSAYLRVYKSLGTALFLFWTVQDSNAAIGWSKRFGQNLFSHAITQRTVFSSKQSENTVRALSRCSRNTKPSDNHVNSTDFVNDALVQRE